MKKVKCALVHGSGMNKITWKPLIQHFPKNWTILTPNLPGHGEENPEPNNLYGLSIWMKRYIKKEKPDIVAGWSMGSFLLQNTINEYGAMGIKVASLINGSPSEKPSSTPKEVLRKRIENYFNDPIRHITPTLNEMKRFWEKKEIDLIAESCRKTDKELLTNLRWDMFDIRFGEKIKKFPIPILLMHGIYDKINPISQAEWVKENSKKSCLYKFKSRHAPFTKDPKDFVEKMVEGYSILV